TSFSRDWSSDVCSSDLAVVVLAAANDHAQIIAVAGGAPAPVAKDGFKPEAGKVVGQPLDTLLNMLRQFQPVLRVELLAFFFAELDRKSTRLNSSHVKMS